ncbi:phosphatase PAP2 family protein [Dietzia sp.]|uniref:phosphatase PAP2 family protein n=1 Tax=Dietzia sp. TaxID=1871616 RepID=UPI002FD9D8C7
MKGVKTLLRSNATMPVAGSLLVVLAVIVGIAVHTGTTSADDQRVLGEFIENRSPWITTWMVFVTNAFSPTSTIIISLFVAAAAWLRGRKLADAGFVVATVGLASAITFVLKLVFQRGRPPVVDQLIGEFDFSFPSGHTTGVAALAFATAWVFSTYMRRRWAISLLWAAAAACVAIVAASRLYLGVHWFTDTIAGACVGVGVAMLLAAALPAARAWRPQLPEWAAERRIARH